MEGKGADAEGEEEVPRVDIFNDVVAFCESPKFTQEIERFQQRHLHMFASRAYDSKYPEEDQPVEYYELFKDYQSLIDNLLTDFAAEKGTNARGFYQNCIDVGE
jgi:hypothetical protein